MWLRHGLSHPAFATRLGALFFNAARPISGLSHLLGGTALEAMLLARHAVIDAQLDRAIRSGVIGQVLEVAAGLSPRGVRFCQRFGDLQYIEADLAAMAANKRSILAAAELASDRHRVVEIDALADSGEDSVAAVCARELDPKVGTAIITECLLPYFDAEVVAGMWERFGSALNSFPAGLYLSDLHVEADIEQVRGGRAFRRILNQLTRGEHHRYFADVELAMASLLRAGFETVQTPYASDFADTLKLASRKRTGNVRIVIAEATRSV